MRYRLLFLLSFLTSAYQIAYTQNTYSLGTRLGFGFNISGANASYEMNGNTYAMRSNAFYAGGILGQYLLRDRFGIETGLVGSYQTYAPKDLVAGSLKNFLGWNFSEGITDYQVPVQFIYKFNHPSNPYKRFLITAGASIDWLLPEYFKKERNAVTASNLLFGLRMANRKGKLGRTELGVEFQYSFRGRFSYTMQTEYGPEIFKARYCLLSFNFNYFFFNRTESSRDT